jgi:hypothetical protein
MTTLRNLSEQIEKKIRLVNHDVEPIPHPSIRGIRAFCEVSFDILIRDLETWTSQGRITKLKNKGEKSISAFIDTIKQAKHDLDKHRHLSFWHFGVICYTTCFAYEELLKQKKHVTIALNEQSTWNNPNWEVAVLFLNFAAGKLYPNALTVLKEVCDQPGVDAQDVCRFLLKRINMLHG